MDAIHYSHQLVAMDINRGPRRARQVAANASTGAGAAAGNPTWAVARTQARAEAEAVDDTGRHRQHYRQPAQGQHDQLQQQEQMLPPPRSRPQVTPSAHRTPDQQPAGENQSSVVAPPPHPFRLHRCKWLYFYFYILGLYYVSLYIWGDFTWSVIQSSFFSALTAGYSVWRLSTTSHLLSNDGCALHLLPGASTLPYHQLPNSCRSFSSFALHKLCFSSSHQSFSLPPHSSPFLTSPSWLLRILCNPRSVSHLVRLPLLMLFLSLYLQDAFPNQLSRKLSRKLPSPLSPEPEGLFPSAGPLPVFLLASSPPGRDSHHSLRRSHRLSADCMWN